MPKRRSAMELRDVVKSIRVAHTLDHTEWAAIPPHSQHSCVCSKTRMAGRGAIRGGSATSFW